MQLNLKIKDKFVYDEILDLNFLFKDKKIT